MLKKIYKLIVAFTIAISLAIVGTPANAAQNMVEEVEKVVELAPDTMYVSHLPYTGLQQYIFYETQAYGYSYRGYISVMGVLQPGLNLYHGTLYRDPLPYPTPFSNPIEF